jgi:hypothetical protein
MMRVFQCVLLLSFCFFLACDQGTTPVADNKSGNPDGLMKIVMDMSNAPAEVDRLEGKLFNEEGDEIFFDFEIEDHTARAEVENIPIGRWTLLVNALDDDGNIIYTGTAEVTVHPGVVTPVSLHLNAATGSLSITVTWGGNGGTDDRFEENDSQSSATPLYEYTYYRNLYVSASDDDWYSMTISADSLSIMCNFDHSNGDINMDLVDRNGNVLASAKSATNNERIHFIVDRLGTYYIHIYMAAGSSNTYTFWWDDIWQGER